MPSSTHRVLWIDEVSYSLDGCTPRPLPATLWDSEIMQVFARLIELVGGNGVLLLARSAAIRLGMPFRFEESGLPVGDLAKTHPLAVAWRAEGWRCREVHRWTTLARGSDLIHIGLLEFIDGQFTPWVDKAPEVITGSLAAWHDITGTAWKGSAGDAANEILRQRIRYRDTPRGKEKMPDWWAEAGPEEGCEEMPYLPSTWGRPAEQGCTAACALDRCRAYLGAMTCTTVAATALEHSPHTLLYQPRAAGEYLITEPQWELSEIMPSPGGYSRRGWPRWVAHPRVALLAELQQQEFTSFEILDAWLAPATDVVKKLGETLRVVWDRAPRYEPAVREQLRGMVKGAYHQVHGSWRSAKKQGDVQRGDWGRAIVAQNAANTWRRAWQLGQGPDQQFQGPWPLWIDTDSIVYPQGAIEIAQQRDWTIWDSTRADLDDVTRLGHWRTGGTYPINPDTGFAIQEAA